MIPFVFQQPWMLLLLLAVISLGGILRYARRRRRIVLEEMGTGKPPPYTKWRDLARLTSLTLMVIAAAKPGFDPQRNNVSQSGRDVVFVLDVSRSMLAEDASPNRLNAAKNGVRDVLDALSTERVGLVIYAGNSNILCPLTYDYNFVRYMLDQATTRAVDFGGTILLSAVEKSIDNVLLDGREGMHDLIVLTDGEEHGAENERVKELLEENGVGLLLVGVGDPSAGSRIPITDEEGRGTYVKYEGDFVTTRLKDKELRELVRGIDNAAYQSVGASSFDLAGLYLEYVAEKPASGGSGDQTYVTYREAGFPLMILALLLLIIAEGRVIPKITINKTASARVVLLGFFLMVSTYATELGVEARLNDALTHQKAGRYSEALESFALIVEEGGSRLMNNKQLATIAFNEGLCYLAQAESQASQEPKAALGLVMQARSRFLNARRMKPDFDRAGQRLDPVAQMIVDYQKKITEEEQRQQEIEEKMQALIEMLQALLESQTELRSDVPSRPQQPRGPSTQSLDSPENAAVKSTHFTSDQLHLIETANNVRVFMGQLDQAMTPKGIDIEQLPVSILHEPLQLIAEAIEAQNRAAEQLRQWTSWPDARLQQQIAIDKIKSILDLLASDQSEDWDEGDWEDWEEDWDDMEFSDSEGGMNASMDGQGDLAAGAEMQALPLPNYSVEDILMEEQGSLQFRQQQRAVANKGKVEKDW
ncbi:MAG: VWA domain-containing protein [Verrucomicrobiales bacterium]|nr:VWA domain-containing protein [Verrucomicrobiales bacterium]